MRGLTVCITAALPATLFLDWFEVAGEGRFSGWESLDRSAVVVLALCVE